MIKKFLLSGLFLTILALSSCIDDTYDIKDIDATLSFGTQDKIFWLPKSNTGNIEIGNFINVTDGDYIKIKEDDDNKKFYCVEGDGYYDLELDINIPPEIPIGTTFTIPESEITTINTATIDLRNRPATLNNIRLDLKNPLILLETNSEASNDIECEMKFECFRQQESGSFKKDLDDIEIAPFTAKAKKTEYYYLCDNKVDNEPIGYTWTKTSNLHQKMLDIPDFIEMKLKKLETVVTSSSSEKCALNNKFRLYAPLVVGPNFEFTNDTKEKGWFSDLKMDSDNEIEYAIESICMKATVYNSMSLQLTIEAQAIDIEEQIIPDIIITPVENINPQGTTEILLELKVENNTITQYLKEDSETKLDGILLSIKASGGASENNEPLRPTDYIKVTNMQLGLKGNVIVNAN